MKKDTILLDFEKAICEQLLDKHIREGVSSITFSGDYLWVAGDENISVQRLEKMPDGSYGNAANFFLQDYIELPAPGDEADVEGMEVAGNYLWIVGSHSYKRKKMREGKDPAEEIERLAKVSLDPNRNLLARIPLVKDEHGVPVLQKEVPDPENPGRSLRAAKLKHAKKKWSQLTSKLKKDKHLNPFVGLPGKDNGLDIEGLAIYKQKVFLGLRGPVLRGWAIILEVELEEEEPGLLKLRKAEDTGTYYKKHFIHLNGMGIRELHADGEDLIILAGPTMDLDGTMEIYRWRGAALHPGDQVVSQQDIESMLVLPHRTKQHGVNKAEGIAMHADGSLIIAYDSPDSSRKVGDFQVKADIYRPEK
jgi:hypothetical protein